MLRWVMNFWRFVTWLKKVILLFIRQCFVNQSQKGGKILNLEFFINFFPPFILDTYLHIRKITFQNDPRNLSDFRFRYTRSYISCLALRIDFFYQIFVGTLHCNSVNGVCCIVWILISNQNHVWLSTTYNCKSTIVYT